MIVKMQRLAVVCTAASEIETLDALRDLGVMHLDANARADAPALKDAEASLASANKALAIASEQLSNRASEQSSDIKLSTLNSKLSTITPETVLQVANDLATLESTLASVEKDIATYTPFGEFKPADAAALTASGIQVRLFAAGYVSEPKGSDGSIVKIISDDPKSKRIFGAIIGDMELAEDVEVIPLPEKSLSEMNAEAESLKADIAKKNTELAAFAAYTEQLKEIAREREGVRDYAAAAAGMGDEGGVKWICGYVPEEKLAAVRDASKSHGWGVIAREPRDDEEPPTLVNPPKIFKPILALFNLLGILPGYREADVSIIFYSFFTIFFAMLVGDAGYGILMLVLTLILRIKFKKAPSAPFALMAVFSIATIIWGVLSGTYFGIVIENFFKNDEGTPIPLENVPLFAKWLRFKTTEWFNDREIGQTHTMQFCFILGALHLSAARIWNACSLFPSKKFLAEIGWIGIIWTMYCASCQVVANIAFPVFMYYVAGISTLLIFCFMLDKSELKTRGTELGMLPLNIISALGDIISYVRLFAVGLSSVKVAENFNEMAINLNLPLAAKIPCVILILLLGHGMNLAMGALSILVHAVRLNTLEFSNHKGVTWSGYDYRPFKKR